MTSGIEIFKLEMVNISKDTVAKSLLVDGDAHKRAAVENLGITIQTDEKPVEAWLRHLAEINNIPVTKPCDPKIKDAILGSPEARKFLFFVS